MKSLSFLLIVFVFLGTAWAEDGYWFSSLDDPTKAAYIVGFIGGHRVGEWKGQLQGRVFEAAEVISLLEKEAGIEIDANLRSQIEKQLYKHVADGTLTTYTIDPATMTREIEAFYRTYPLCKKRRIDFFLSEFMVTWANDKQQRKSYKEIGEHCAEAK